MINAVIRALEMALAMGWEILWPLILGFALSAVVQAAVSHRQMSRLLPDNRPRSIATALALGAAGIIPSHAVTDGSVAAYSLVGTASIERIVKKAAAPIGFHKE